MLCPLTLPLPRVLNPSRLTYLINLIKLFFTCTFILYSTLLFSVLKIKFKIGMCTKVAVSSVIDGGRKLVEVEVVNNGPKVFLFKFLSYLYKYMYAVQRIISHTQTLTYLASWIQLDNLKTLITLLFNFEISRLCLSYIFLSQLGWCPYFNIIDNNLHDKSFIQFQRIYPQKVSKNLPPNNFKEFTPKKFQRIYRKKFQRIYSQKISKNLSPNNFKEFTPKKYGDILEIKISYKFDESPSKNEVGKMVMHVSGLTIIKYRSKSKDRKFK